MNSMDKKKDIDAIHREARRSFMNIPNVIGVGYGYKQKGNQRTSQLSLVVVVTNKVPESELPPGDIIPKEFKGVKTDVILSFDDIPLSCKNTRHYDPIIGGITISIDNSGLEEGEGTLGCFGTINGNTSRDNIVLLSNAHVLSGLPGDKVYHPFYDGDTIDEFKSNREGLIGKIHKILPQANHHYRYPGDEPDTEPGIEEYFLDCATAKINTCHSLCCPTNCGVEYSPELDTLFFVEGPKRIQATDLSEEESYMVFKVGRRTGLTMGRIAHVNVTYGTNEFNRKHNIILVEPVEDNCEGKRKFADHGDSGSVVVNANNEVIGLLYGMPDASEGDPLFGHGLVSHIHPVLHHLNISILRTPSPDGSDQRSHAMKPVRETAPANRKQLEGIFIKTPEDEELYEVSNKHRYEVVWLVNHCRQVTVAWHRYHGPAFVAAIVGALSKPGNAIPTVAKGIPIGVLLAKMQAVLYEHGTAALKEDIERFAGRIIQKIEKLHPVHQE